MNRVLLVLQSFIHIRERRVGLRRAGYQWRERVGEGAQPIRTVADKKVGGCFPLSRRMQPCLAGTENQIFHFFFLFVHLPYCFIDTHKQCGYTCKWQDMGPLNLNTVVPKMGGYISRVWVKCRLLSERIAPTVIWQECMHVCVCLWNNRNEVWEPLYYCVRSSGTHPSCNYPPLH